MRHLFITIVILAAPTSFAEESKNSPKQSTDKFITGGWNLEVFTTTGVDESPKDWCEGMHGLIMYTKSGQMSVAINCKTSQSDKNVYYAGSYEV